MKNYNKFLTIIGKIEKSNSFWFLLAVSLVFFILRFPSLFEPNWYGDEGIYQVMGKGIREGRLPYLQIWDNKPPLLYAIYAVLNSDLFTVRAASLLVGILTIIVFFFLAQRLFKNRKSVYISTSVFAVFFGIPLLEGNIANAENFMLFPIISSFVILLSKFKKSLKQQRFAYFIAGMLIGVAFLVKIVAIFDFAAFLIFAAIVNFESHDYKKVNLRNLWNSFKKTFKFVLPYILGFLFPIAAAFLFFIFNGALEEFVSAVFLQMVGYVNYANSFIIPQGVLIAKLLALAIFTVFMFRLRKTFSEASAFIAVWFAFSLFNAYFAQRPYTHYLLVLLPAFSLMIGSLMEPINKRAYRLCFLLLIAGAALILVGFRFSGKTPFYYKNFISFATGNKSVDEYREFFDRKTPTDYMVAQYIEPQLEPQDQVFIWGNNAQLYYMLDRLPPGRFSVAYHVSGEERLRETQKALANADPKFIVKMPYMKDFPFQAGGYQEKIRINNVIIYEKAL